MKIRNTEKSNEKIKMKNTKNSNFIWNKKAYYRFADIGMFFISFAIIAVGIMIGIYIFYSNSIDVRSQEAKIIFDKLTNAVIKDDKLRDEVFADDFNIYNEAGLNKKIINSGDYYFKIEIIQKGKLIKKFEEGTRSFEVECGLAGEKLPKCYPKDSSNALILNDYNVKILAGSNQQGREV